MPSPPKPWETNNGGSATSTTSPITSPSAAATTMSSEAPPIPTRSNATTTGALGTMNRTGAYGTTGYGSSYGGYGTGYGSGYGSSYGGYGSGIGSSYGGYGGYSRLGGYGGYGSYGRMGMGMGYGGGYGRMGMYGNQMGGPGEEPGLTQRMEMGTRATFEVIEQIVGAFGGFAQMLESTFMATHSSFMAMVGVAEQLSYLKSYLGQVFSIFALFRLVKRLIYKLSGRTLPGKPQEMNLMEFQSFEQATAGPKMSRKPLMIFLLMVVGLPYLMHKLIKLIASSQQVQQRQLQQQALQNPAMGSTTAAQIDPSKLEFARALYDFTAESPMELSLQKGDIVAILSKMDPVTNQLSQWWRGRLRDGKMGMFPATYVEIVQKGGGTGEPKALPAADGESLVNSDIVEKSIAADMTAATPITSS
ncbi:Peroxin 13, N-terminal region-domain-containing protein [Radiomyces spectabilis]|uniref:Peroxin 13, N-terminal region-domain-containing protein n=1 Tax=Radiomyces spectabilis TaxID=64574 RepID=UPI00221E655D|nr:Peroxin 13, N-terminal region-domain-containing protein [Radiomyces spectabilis]KAI8378063.1 Peroxin 13, N-terminal region-domain-containing protein [Radiomyces spectabilis]